MGRLRALRRMRKRAIKDYEHALERTYQKVGKDFEKAAQGKGRPSANKEYAKITAKVEAKYQRKNARQQRRREAADLRERETGTRQSPGVMIAKIAGGLLFFAVGVSPSEGGFSLEVFLVGAIIGLALITWGLLPFLAGRHRKAKEVESARHQFEQENAPAVCPACGAPTKGIICEYCGTPLNKSSCKP